MVDVWFSFYQKEKGSVYNYTGVDGKHMKHLLRIVGVQARTIMGGDDAETVIELWMDFLNKTKGHWALRDNMDLSNLHRKFNVLWAFYLNPEPKDKPVYQSQVKPLTEEQMAEELQLKALYARKKAEREAR